MSAAIVKDPLFFRRIPYDARYVRVGDELHEVWPFALNEKKKPILVKAWLEAPLERLWNAQGEFIAERKENN